MVRIIIHTSVHQLMKIILLEHDIILVNIGDKKFSAYIMPPEFCQKLVGKNVEESHLFCNNCCAHSKKML